MIFYQRLNKLLTQFKYVSPILSLVRAYSFQGGPIIARFLPRDQEIVDSYLSLPEVRKLLPENIDMQNSSGVNKILTV